MSDLERHLIIIKQKEPIDERWVVGISLGGFFGGCFYFFGFAWFGVLFFGVYVRRVYLKTCPHIGEFDLFEVRD